MAKKTKLKLTTGTALIVAVIVLIIVIAFGASGQTAKFFAARTQTAQYQIQTPATTQQVQPGLPDLIVSDTSWSFTSLQIPGGGMQQVYLITVAVKNQGTAGVNKKFDVTLTDVANNVQLPPIPVFIAGGQTVCTIPNLAVGKTDNSCVFVAGVGDTKPFSVTAYADVPVKFALVPNIGAIKESNENNNAQTIKMGCSLYPAPVCGNGRCEKHNVKNNCDDFSEALFPVSICPDDCSVCGDGIVSGSKEQCDDGNKISGDGCSSKCINELSGPIQPQEILP